MKIDYPPLLAGGFQEIGHWQLDALFLNPFPDYQQERRRFLIDQTNRFLEELHKLNIPLVVWIDGSFTTRKTEPDDVDMVVWVRESDAESLSPERLLLFDQLLHIRNHEYVKATYDIDVYLADPDSATACQKWAEEFGQDRSSLNAKGIFTLSIHNV